MRKELNYGDKLYSAGLKVLAKVSGLTCRALKSKPAFLTGMTVLLLSLCLSACKKNSSSDEPAQEELSYESTNDIFPNPERGFTRTMPVYSNGASLTAAQLQGLRAQGITLVVRVFYFDLYKDKPLDQAALALVRTDLDVLRQTGLKAVVRFAYTDAIDGADAPLAVVEQHMDQLKPVLEQNKDVIAFVQAGFIGAWGEWHNSSNGLSSVDNQRKVLAKLLSVVPKEIMVQVRTPRYKQQIYNTTLALTKTQGFSEEDIARVGHHNDCFLSSADDYGTYENVSAEKQYISNEALYVPVGGETCPPLAGFSANCTEGRNQMKLLKWTYINLDYYQPTINAWKSSGCFEEFQRSLGYRLSMLSSKLAEQAPVDGSFSFSLKMINSGYAPVYNKKVSSIIFKNTATGAYYSKPLAFDIRECKPSATVSIDQSISLSGLPAGTYSLYLRIADQAPDLSNRAEYAIRLANRNTWLEENGGMNDLKSTLLIN